MFLFEFTVDEPGGAGELDISIEDAPDRWKTAVPLASPDVRNGTARIPVLVAVPFNHQHEGLESAILKVQSGRSVARVPFGLFYPPIPQPAGHHSMLWLHSQQRDPTTLGGHYVFMNTLEDDPDDDGTPVASRGVALRNPPEIAVIGRWEIPLDPRLGVGLAFAEGPATARIVLEAPMPATEVRVKMDLWLEGHGWIVQLPFTAPADVLGRRTFDLAGTTPAQSFGTAPAGSLTLRVEAWGLHVPGPEGMGLMLVPAGGQLQLPLEEFRDPLNLQGLAKPLDLANLVRVNPGETRQIVIRAPGAPFSSVGYLSTRDWVATAYDHSKDWIIAVRAPADAAHGDTIDVAVWGESDGLRLDGFRVEVDTDEDHPDERTPQTDALFGGAGVRKDTPLAWWLPVGGGGLVWAVRRRGVHRQ